MDIVWICPKILGHVLPGALLGYVPVRPLFHSFDWNPLTTSLNSTCSFNSHSLLPSLILHKKIIISLHAPNYNVTRARDGSLLV
jgi:hypothetical protein